MLKKYPYIHQRDETDCGVACLATIIKYYGHNISVSKLREEAGTDRLGTNILGLINAAKENGLLTKAIKNADLCDNLLLQTPFIAHIRKEDKNRVLLHFVVVYELDNEYVIYADPAKGIIREYKYQFLKQWTGNIILCIPAEDFQSREESQSLIRKIYKIIIGEKSALLTLLIFSFFFTVLGIVGSLFYRIVIDNIIPKNQTELLFKVTIAFVVVMIFQNLFSYLRTEVLLQISKKFDTEILMGYYKHILKLPLKFFASRKTGELITRFNDASKVREALSSAIVAMMLDMILAFAAGVMLVMQNPILFLVCIFICFLYGIAVCVFNKKMRNINEKQMKESADLSAYMVESLNGIETIKALNVEEKFICCSSQKFDCLMKTVINNGRLTNLQSCLSACIANIGKILVLCIGSYYVIHNQMSIGTLMMFYMLMDYFLNPIKTLFNLQPVMQTGRVAAERVYEMMDLRQEDIQSGKKNMDNDIVVKNLTFRYASRKKVIDDVTMKLEKGKKTAIIGESGSGKSTLGKILLGLYDVERGHVRYGETDINDISKNVIRNQIAYVPQNIDLFAGTIIENITLGVDQIDYNKLQEICNMVKVDDFVRNLPMGYHTKVEEGGANFSGGQKQRIAIARALIKNPKILILDEATSNLDAITEKAFSEAMKKYGKYMTTVVIAHRLSTIMNCDSIYVMERGKIIENGTHEDLIKKKGFYYEYWKSQTVKEKCA